MGTSENGIGHCASLEVQASHPLKLPGDNASNSEDIVPVHALILKRIPY